MGIVIDVGCGKDNLYCACRVKRSGVGLRCCLVTFAGRGLDEPVITPMCILRMKSDAGSAFLDMDGANVARPQACLNEEVAG